MRDALAMLEGQRIVVRGVVERFGVNLGGSGRPESRTVLLRPVVAPGGAFLCDHLWLPLTAAMAALDLRRGDVVELSGRVAPYQHARGGTDYKLARPTRARRVEAPGLAPPEPDPRAMLRRRLKRAAGLAGTAGALLDRVHAALGDPTERDDWYGALLGARGQVWTIAMVVEDARRMLAQLEEGESHAADH